MGTAQQEIPVDTETIQQEGLLDEMVYLILKDDCGQITVEGCYISEQKAELRLAVLLAELDLRLAKACERYSDENLSHCDIDSPGYWIASEKLIR